MASALSIDRLKLRLPPTDIAEAHRLALRVAEALAASAPGLDPGDAIPTHPVRVAAGEPSAMASRIAKALLGRHDGEAS